MTCRACHLIRDATAFQGEIHFDPSLPDGTPRKLLDISKLNALGWQPTIPLKSGIAQTDQWYLANGRYDPNLAPAGPAATGVTTRIIGPKEST